MLKLFCFFIILFSSELSLADNAIQDHPSAYIRLHANDAVKWRLWDQSVLDQAEKENKLIRFETRHVAKRKQSTAQVNYLLYSIYFYVGSVTPFNHYTDNHWLNIFIRFVLIFATKV